MEGEQWVWQHESMEGECMGHRWVAGSEFPAHVPSDAHPTCAPSSFNLQTNPTCINLQTNTTLHTSQLTIIKVV